MMTKLLSLVLSFTILFTTVAPSYAQARNAARRAGAAQPAAVKQYDDMKEHDCKRDAKGNVVAVDFSLPKNEKALQEMLASANAFEWKSCAYVAGLKNYFEKNPKRARSLTAWQRNSVIYPATEQYIKRWNANSAARENSTFREIFVGLNAVVMKDVPDTQTAYIFRPTKNKFLRAVDSSAIEAKVEEKTSAGQADGSQSTGSIFGLPGGTRTFSGPSADLLKEVEKVYEILTQDPSENNKTSAALSYEEFAELYEQDVRYAYSGAMADNAQQHINKPGWSEYVAKMNQAMEKELSAAKIKEAYDEYLKNLEQMDGSIQEGVQEYLQDLAAQIWEMYSADKDRWLSVVQDVFPVFQMYGGLSDSVRRKAAAAMREEIRKHQDDCEKPGFFSMLTLKGLAQTVTLHQSQAAKELVSDHVMKMNASCAYATKAVTTLAVLGQWGESTEDSKTIQEWFKKGFNFSSSGMVIPAALSALLAMGAYKDAADMVAYAGAQTDSVGIVRSVLGAYSPLEWTQAFHSGESIWSEQVNLDYSYYVDEKGLQHNIWLDTADLLVSAYAAADAREQKRMNEFFRQAVESLITPRDPRNKFLRFALPPFLVGLLTKHMISVRLSDTDFGAEPPYANTSAHSRVSVLLDLDKIVDKKNKKVIEGWFKYARKGNVPYHAFLMWYLFTSPKDDVQPEMRLVFDSRLAGGIYSSTNNESWKDAVSNLMTQKESSLAKELDSFDTWTIAKNWLTPLDDLLTIVFVAMAGKGIFNLLKFVGRSIGVVSGNAVNLLRMMRSVQLRNVPQMGKNLGRMLKVGLKEFKSSSFARLKTVAIRNIRTKRNMPKFTPKATEPTMGPSAGAPNAAGTTVPKHSPASAGESVASGNQVLVEKPVYVQGERHFVPIDWDVARVARKFGVPQREISWVSGRPAFNYGAGEAANGSTGVRQVVGRPGEPVTIHPREVAVKPEVPASLVKPGEKAALVFQNGEWRAVAVPEDLTRAEIANSFKVSADDVDYVVKFADGTFAPEWAEYSLVWDGLQSPAPSSTAFKLTRWKWMKANAAATFDIFTNNLRDLVRFTWRNPVRAVGAAGSSFGFGGVAPVAIYAEAPAMASQVVSFGEISARLLSATRAAETAGAVSTATSAGAEMAGATRAATQLGGGWSNLFWGAGRGVTDWRFLTPVGALPSAGRNAGWNREFSKWATQEAFKQHQTRLNQWLFVSDALQRQINPWFARDTWKDFSVSLTLSYQEWRMLRAGNRYYLNSLKESGVSSTETTVTASADTQAAETNDAADTPNTETAVTASAETVPVAAAPADPGESAPLDAGRQDEETSSTTTETFSSSGILYSGIPVMAIWKMISRMPSLAKEFSADVVKWFSPRASEDTFVAPTVTTPTKTSLPRSHVTTPVATVPAATPQVNPDEGTTPDWDGNATVNLEEDNTLYLDEEADKRDLTFEAEASVYGNAFLDAFGEPGSVDGDEEDPWQDADATSEWDDWAAQADDDDPFSSSGILYSGIPVMAIWKMISRMPSLAKEFSADVVKWFSPRASEDTFVAPTVTTPTKTSLPRSHVTTPVATVPAATPQVNPDEGTTPDWDGNATVNLEEDNTLYLDEEADKRDLTFEAEASVYGNAFLDAFGEPGSVDGDEEDPWQDADATSEWDDWAAQADDDDPFSSSGILYSGIPVMELEKIWTEAYNGIVRILSNRVDTYAQDVLNRKNPLLTELRDIVTGDASRRLKEQALLRLHKQFNVFSAVIGHLPVESRNKFNALKQDDTQVAKFLYNLYSTGQLDNVLAGLNNHIPVDELSKQLEEITSTPEFDAARRKVYDETEVLPFDANDWQGYVESVQDVDKGLIEQLFRPAGWAAQSAADGKEDSKGNVYYENDIPVYYRNSKGDLSAHPVIILHQDVLSSRLAEAWADLLNKVGLSTGKGFKIPKGLVLALDENGRFKLVLQPGHRADLLNSKTGRKMKETIYSEGSLPVNLSTQYSTTDLLAVARLLEAGVKADFQLTLDAPSSFSLFVALLGAFSGLGADTVMVGPFKEAAGPDNPAVPNAFGGVGYVTPRVAAATVDDMKTWGVSRSVVALLTVTLTTLVVSALMGINGLVPKEEFSLIALAVPLLVLITGGSMIRSVIPLILNAYKDPRQRTAANLDVATWQQGSKLFMFFATAFWWGAGEKFVAVPIAATLVLATLGLFFNTPAGRKVLSDTVTAFKDHPKESFKAMGKGSLILGKHLLKGFVEGVFAPVIWGGKQVKAGFEWASSKLKSSRETTTSAAAQAGSETGAVPTEGAESAEAANARYQAEYEESFKKNPEVKKSLLRVTLAYASYAASLMLLNQLAEGPIDGSLSPLIDELLNQLPEGPIGWLVQKLIGVGVGKWLTFAFASASFLVRLFASKWVKSGKFTDDQLTGISFAGMSLAALGLAGVPYEGLGIVAVLLLGIILFASTAVPGQLDQARLQNLVSAMVQSQKNEVLQDKSLSQAEKEAKIADLEAKESKWAGWAKADYDKANANGIWGVYAAIILSIALPRLGIGDWSWIARSVFIYAGVVAGLGALNTGDHSLSFLRALFSKKKTLVVTAEDIAAGKVNAETFGMTDAGKANKLVPSLLKGKDSLKTLKEQLMPYGVVAISSEVKLTKVLKRLIEIHNRFVASAEKLGDEALHASFEEVLAVAKDFNAVMKGSNVSESLRREFAKLVTALCVDGSLDKGVLSHPAYMEEGSFAMPINYRNLLEARDIIKELDQLATNIGQGGAAVNANTYGQFVQYHAEAKRLLQTYAAENPSESLIVKLEEERIRLLCLKLKNANSVHNVLRANAGQTPAKDIQNLEDILRVYEGNMTISSEWVVFYQSATEEAIGFFEAHPAMAQEVERMLASVEAENWKEFMGMDAMGLPRESEVEDVAAGIIGSAATAPKLSGTSELQALYIAPLEELLQATQQGQTLDEATQGDIAELYLRADQAMTQYLNAHPKEGAAVVAMHTQLDKLYTQLIGEAPTKEKVAELAKKSSGLMSMVDWFGQLWEDLLAWFKGGDDSPGANDGSGDLSALPSTGGGAVQLARLPGKKEVDAVIFDMDGTLLNTLGAWKNSTSNFLRSRGIEPPENIDAEMAALSLLEGARVLKERYGFKESPEELLEEVLATVRKFYEEDAMPKPGVPGVLQALKKQGIKICVATASDREFAEAAFKRTGLMEYIDFIITCDEVGVGKQNPLVYETALKKLGTDRKRTLVVEDALHALQTAKKAGFPTAGVYEVNFAADQSALQSDATYYVPSFQTVAVGN